MRNFDYYVPFDPGFEPMTFSFVERIKHTQNCYAQLKNNFQKKLWLPQAEIQVLKLINLSTAFHLGCMLWGGFIHYRFKENPKKISGNNTAGLSEQELLELDCAIEAKAILKYIENFDRDCKYFLKRPMQVSPLIKEILENYIEFAEANGNFINVNKTDEVKLPKALEHFKNLSDEKLDDLCEKIYSTIESEQIQDLLDIGFYNN